MSKLLVVADNDGTVKAAAKVDSENEHSVMTIELQSEDESIYEVELPSELESGLDGLVDYRLESGAQQPQLVKRT
ncbi:hypothetical protein AB0H49_23375 [Nocardia sp. NPDC050713]|uniref:hypothetical protein n=1 Tax=unclassified Nocardia TaxID=2637762 RepID=UPI0033A48CF1